MLKVLKAMVLTGTALMAVLGVLTTVAFGTGVKSNLVSQYENEENWRFVVGIKTADCEYDYSVFNPTSEVLNVSLDEQLEAIINK